jgi:thiol:disulfide interchange protein DsbD
MKRILRPYRWWLSGGIALAVLVGILLLVPPPRAGAQLPEQKHVSFTISAFPSDPFSDQNALPPQNPLEVRPGEKFLVVIEGAPQFGWHTYPVLKHTDKQGTVQLSKVRLKDATYFADLWPVTESEPTLVDKGSEIGTEYEYEGPFTWILEVLVRPDAPPKQTLNVEIDVRLQVCDANQCIPDQYVLSIPVRVSSVDAVKLSDKDATLLKEYDAAKAKERADKEKKNSRSPSPDGTPSASSFDWQQIKVVDSPTLEEVSGGVTEDSGLWGTIVTAMLGGFISLLTPCVFPMIPVTVSFFLKRGENNQYRPLTMAAVYCATIVAVLTAGGVVLVRLLQEISQHWITNVFLTVVFVFFALSLLGMYEIALPSGLANLTGSREGKAGLTGIVFMALTFSIISFACVGPIYGGFITLEASQSSAVSSWLQRLLGPLAFSVAFASPFFALALFPNLLRAMPRSGSWMNSVKVVMGFLELAAAFKFVRAAELNLFAKTDYFTFDLVLGTYVALAAACGLYLLNLYRLPHDYEAAESVGVTRLGFALVFLALAIYLLPGTFKDARGRSQKPHGVIYEEVRSFLLPDDPSDWHTDLGTAIALAERENKPLFIDFTGLG